MYQLLFIQLLFVNVHIAEECGCLISLQIWSYHYADEFRCLMIRTFVICGLYSVFESLGFWWWTRFVFSWYLILLQYCCVEDEPGKQVRSAIGIKNTCKSHVAFKVWSVCRLLFFGQWFWFWSILGIISDLIAVVVPNDCTKELLHASSRGYTRSRWKSYCNW